MTYKQSLSHVETLCRGLDMESLPHVSLDILLLTQWFLQFWGLLFGSEIATEVTPVGGLRFTGFYRSISQYFTIYHLIWENAFFSS